MKTKFSYILLSLLLFHLALSDVYAGVGIGNKITISGVVKDQSNEPIIGATVILTSGSSSNATVTDINGVFQVSLTSPEQKTFRIKASYVGYKDASGTYYVSSLTEGQGTVTVKMIEDTKKNKKKSSEIVAQGFSSISSSFDDFISAFGTISTEKKQTPQQLYNKANNYYYGKNGVSQDYKKAFELYMQAAEQGHAGSQTQLGYMYDAGRGTSQNKKEAVYWYKKSAEQGNQTGQYNLALSYKKGEGVEKDLKTAAYWYQKAAEEGFALAQSGLADLYYYGNGVEKDYAQAFYWAKKAADQGDSNGQFRLACLYFYGSGTEKNFQLAMQWYLKAAEQGDATAMSNIGIMYENGKGVSIDKPTALSWYNKAADKGNEKAKTYAAKLVAQGIKPATLSTSLATNLVTNQTATQSTNSQLSVTSFKLLENDLTATTRGTEKRDYNGERAALIKIVTPERGFAFDGGALGIVSTEDRTGEIWVYVPNRAQKLTIRHSSHGVLRDYYYPVAIKSGRTYELVLQTGSSKYQKQTTTNKPSTAQTTKHPATQTTYTSQKRYALIIGNGDYLDGTLKNPTNDAMDMRAKLKKLGFEVMGTTNIKTKGAMRDSVRRFCAKAKYYDAVLFFYSGHARQDNGTNYLIPTRTDIQSEGDIEDQCLSMNWVVKEMQSTGSKNVIVVLDACRNAPPIPQLTRDGGVKGLADMPAKAGTFIGFSTRSGAVALDGRGQRNSPYTAALLKMLDVPGINHVDLFNRVKKEVYNATGKKQMPTVDDQLVEDFIFNQKR